MIPDEVLHHRRRDLLLRFHYAIAPRLAYLERNLIGSIACRRARLGRIDEYTQSIEPNLSDPIDEFVDVVFRLPRIPCDQ